MTELMRIYEAAQVQEIKNEQHTHNTIEKITA